MKLAEQIAAMKRTIQGIKEILNTRSGQEWGSRDLNGLLNALATLDAAGKWAEECEEIGLHGFLAPAFARGRPAVTGLYRAIRGED